MKKVAILGSTGSIGTQAVDIITNNPDRFVVTALAARGNVSLIAKQARLLRPKIVALFDEAAAGELSRLSLPGVEVLSGPEGMIAVAAESGADIVLAAMMGSAGLGPTLAAIDAGIDIALANKETLVCAGALVTGRARRLGVKILPVDSEHNAIFQSMAGHDRNHVRRLILTASGGPFWKRTPDQLKNITPEEAVRHPRWNMGAKISVDSATLMNKGLEIIEASFLFDTPQDKIAVLIHPQSIVHSMVEYVDGSIIAQLSTTDMKIPIAYALAYPDRVRDAAAPLNLAALGGLSFYEPDEEQSAVLLLARQALVAGGTMPAVLSAANEEAVALFLDRKIPFTAISEIVREVMERHHVVAEPGLEDIFSEDLLARETAREIGETL